MTALVNRPPVTLDPGHGLFRNDHFQIAYVTNDIERACALFSRRYGIRDYRRLEGELPAGGHIRIELAWCGGLMYELIHASGPGSEVFNGVLPSRLPGNGLAICHHHLGYLIREQAGWDALEREIEEGGWKIVHEIDVQGFLKARIVEVPEIGHYLEYFLPDAGGVAFFEGVPAS